MLALTRHAREPATSAHARAGLVLGLLALGEAWLTHGLAWTALLGLAVVIGFRVKRRAPYLAALALLPGVLAGSAVMLAFADVTDARRVLERYTAVSEIQRGTLVYVHRWGFVDVTHAHPGPYEDALAAIERGDARVRLYVELIDARGGIHVVERTYAWTSQAGAPWALAAAMTLDLERAAEAVQARAPWHLGFAISAYAPHDLPSNLFGVLRAAGRLEPRPVERDRSETLARYRTLEDAERHARVLGYALPPGATARERSDFQAVQRAARGLRRGAVRTYLHPVSR